MLMTDIVTVMMSIVFMVMTHIVVMAMTHIVVMLMTHIVTVTTDTVLTVMNDFLNVKVTTGIVIVTLSDIMVLDHPGCSEVPSMTRRGEGRGREGRSTVHLGGRWSEHDRHWRVRID